MITAQKRTDMMKKTDTTNKTEKTIKIRKPRRKIVIKKWQKTSEILWVFGILFVAFGVAICDKSSLGLSMIAAPAFIIHEALEKVFPNLTVGVVEYAFQGAVLVLLCIIVRKFNWRYLLAFIVAVVYGYALDLFIWLLRDWTVTTAIGKWATLLLGDIVVAFGVTCFFKTYMPLQVYELFVAEIVSKFDLKLTKVKQIFDISMLAISIILAIVLFGDVLTFDWSQITTTSFHNMGLGTILTTAINSTLIGLGVKLIDVLFLPTARFTKLETRLKRN